MIIATTAIGGAGIIVGTLTLGFVGLTLATFFENPIRQVLQGSPIWTIFFLALAVVGIVWQLATTRAWEMEPYQDRI